LEREETIKMAIIEGKNNKCKARERRRGFRTVEERTGLRAL